MAPKVAGAPTAAQLKKDLAELAKSYKDEQPDEGEIVHMEDKNDMVKVYEYTNGAWAFVKRITKEEAEAEAEEAEEEAAEADESDNAETDTEEEAQAEPPKVKVTAVHDSDPETEPKGKGKKPRARKADTFTLCELKGVVTDGNTEKAIAMITQMMEKLGDDIMMKRRRTAKAKTAADGEEKPKSAYHRFMSEKLLELKNSDIPVKERMKVVGQMWKDEKARMAAAQ